MSLEAYFKLNFALMQYHKYSLTEIENMIPWERDIYVTLLQHLEEEKKRKWSKWQIQRSQTKCPSQVTLNRLAAKKKGINSVKSKATSTDIVDVDENVAEVIGIQDNFDLTYGETELS